MGQVEFLCQEHWVNEEQVFGRKVQWFMGICVCDRVHEEAGVNLRRHSQESSTLLWNSSLSGLNG